MIRLFFIFCFILIFINSNKLISQELILPGDYPDPTILRDCNDYYMTHSPFFYKPGFLIWHSTDLFNWEPVTRACPEYVDSAMAPEFVKFEDTYYIYYPTNHGEIFVITSQDIKGPWSKPIQIKGAKGIDPGHIVDQEGNRFLFLNNGWIMPLSKDGLSITGDAVKVYDGWKYPEEWITEGDDMWLESPKLFYKDGYYYMVSAEGGTAGPPTSHMCVVARSKSLYGPWENSPYNPLVHTYSDSEEWWSKGHGTIFNDPEDKWWIIYHAYAKDFHTLGRQTLIEPIEYTADGWFIPSQNKECLINKTKNKGFNLNDNFREDSLNLQWTLWKENDSDAFSLKNEELCVKGKGNGIEDARLLLITPQDHSYVIEVEASISDNASCGLLLFYNENAYSGILIDKDVAKIFESPQKNTVISNLWGENPKLKIFNNKNLIDIFVSQDGVNWTIIGEKIDVSDFHHNNYGGFFALRPALVSLGKGYAKYKNFKYYPVLENSIK